MTKIQNFKMFIDGQWVDSESGKTIEALNPENNEVWATVPEADAKDVDKAVRLHKKLLITPGLIYIQEIELNI